MSSIFDDTGHMVDERGSIYGIDNEGSQCTDQIRSAPPSTLPKQFMLLKARTGGETPIGKNVCNELVGVAYTEESKQERA